MDVTKPPLQPDALDIALGEGEKKKGRKKRRRGKKEVKNGEGGNIELCCGTKKNSTFGHVFEIIWRYEYCFRFLAVLFFFFGALNDVLF